MKSATTGAVSGCVVWIIVLCMVSACLVPAATLVGVATSTSGSSIQFVADNLGPYLCPPNSTAEILTSRGFGVGTDGQRYESTSYTMQCVAADGRVVQEPSQVYVAYWLGLMAAIGLILSVLIAFLLAAPAGVLFASLSSRLRKTNAR
ncbi:MAG: hypothetical protein ABI847_10715 [Anaerolineales bacterium]